MKTEIKDKEELFDLIQEKEIKVEWTFKSDIGPGWIGRGQTMSFYCDNIEVIENAFLLRLKGKLMKLMADQMNYPDHVINGSGNINLENGKLKLSFFWNGAVPYQYPDISGEGECELNLEENNHDSEIT